MSAQMGAPSVDAGTADEIGIEDLRSIVDNMPEGAEFMTADGGHEPEAEEELKEIAAKKAVEADPPKEDPGEKEEPEAKDDPEDDAPPPIERPRSWAKDLDEEWASYPRAAQERIAAREQERDSALRRSQNELADQRKGIQAELDAAKQARQQYEAQLPALMQALQDANAGAFSDIKSVDDVGRLATEDPFRFQQWQAHQYKLQAVAAQKAEADKRASDEETANWSKFVNEQNVKFEEAIPQAEKASLAKMRDAAPKFLADKGFTDSDLNDRQVLRALYDHRIQGFIRDSMRLAEIQAAPKAVASKPVPPVQKPGVPRSGSALDADIAKLESKEELSEHEGWALLSAKMRRDSRR